LLKYPSRNWQLLSKSKNKGQCPLSLVQVQNLWRQSKWNQKDYGTNNWWNTWIL